MPSTDRERLAQALHERLPVRGHENVLWIEIADEPRYLHLKHRYLNAVDAVVRAMLVMGEHGRRPDGITDVDIAGLQAVIRHILAEPR